MFDFLGANLLRLLAIVDDVNNRYVIIPECWRHTSSCFPLHAHAIIKCWIYLFFQESKLYGAHFKEITADAPKSTKITFADSDDE